MSTPFSDSWQGVAAEHVDHYRRVTPEQRTRLEGLAQVIVHEKRWEGCDGLEVTETMRVTIAVQMAVMLLGLDDYYFDRVSTILLYPHTIVRKTLATDVGIVEQSVPVAGEAWHDGTVTFSWPDVRRDLGASYATSNVVIHEMAHQIDRIDGEIGGTPPLSNARLRRRWAQVSRREYSRICRAVARGEPHLWDPYAATNAAEFFAVASETYFRQPHEFAAFHHELFELFVLLYVVDPRPWFDDRTA